MPKGLLQHAGIGSFNLATVNWANLMAAVEDIQTANADEGRLGWATHPRVVKILRTTLKTTADTAVQHDHDRARQRSPATRW